MDIRQLRTFVHIAELGTFSKASERLRIAQPALSRQIRLLEAELKAKLFVRHGRGVSLTSAGELLLDRAASIIRQIEQTRADVAAEAGEISGHVSLGLPPSVGFLLTGPLVEDMRTAFPKVTLKVVEGIGGFVHEWMVGGRLDIGVLFDPKSSRHLEISPLWSEDLHLVGPGSAGLSLTEPVHLAELSKYSLILPSAGHGLRGLLERYTTRHEVELSVEVEADAMRIQKDLVSGASDTRSYPMRRWTKTFARAA